MIIYKSEKDFMDAAGPDAAKQLVGLLRAYPDATGFLLSTVNIMGSLRPAISTVGPSNRCKTLDAAESCAVGRRFSVVGGFVITDELRRMMTEAARSAPQ